MCNHQTPDPIAPFNRLLPEWGQAADEIYQNYHFLNHALCQTDLRLVPEPALQKLASLRNLLVTTIADLIQDLPPTTHRISNESVEVIDRFNHHIHALQQINQHTDRFFEELLQQYPTLQAWFESITD